MSRMMIAFIDGLAYRRLDKAVMPFVGGFPKIRVKSQAGFSTTCWGNLWTGLYPQAHGHWFQVVRAPERSPFGPAAWIPRIAYRHAPWLALMAWQRFLSRRRGNRSVFGYPFMHFVHPHYWKQFDVVEDRVFGEPGFYQPQKYLFEYLTERGVSWKVLGVHHDLRKMQQGVQTLRHQLAVNPDLQSPDLLFVVFADIDYLSHYMGPESPAVRARLGEIDRLIAEIHEKSGGDRELIVLSDHGHVQITDKIDVYEYVPELRDLVHQVEDMYVRVWVERPDQGDRLTTRLRTVPNLRILEDSDLKRHRLPSDRDRHGHIIGVLDHGSSFLRTSWTRFNKFISDHGYLPDHPDLDAFFAGSFISEAVSEGADPELVDFLPTLFDRLGLAPELQWEGRCLLQQTEQMSVGVSR
jgi:predicted AlkP superfamily pyrophosphatase or phosphodiesterase